jgi:soluble lytic murein transglycosylase-like protein
VSAIDYSPAGRWAQFVRALAIVESNENPNQTGDAGRAFGLLQQHPGFFSDYYGRYGFPASVGDTWITAQIKAAAAFLERWVDELGLDLTIQAYNLGVTDVRDGLRNPAYLQRFTEALNKVRAANGD